MEALRSTWTDERLDDLNKRVDDGFARVDDQFKELRAEMNDGFRRVDVRFEALDARFDALQRTLIQCAVGLVGSIVALIIAFILTGH
jgi:hypothetical protein